MVLVPCSGHARFSSADCRMAWHREHVRAAVAPAVAPDWPLIAMTEPGGRLGLVTAGTGQLA